MAEETTNGEKKYAQSVLVHGMTVVPFLDKSIEEAAAFVEAAYASNRVVRHTDPQGTVIFLELTSQHPVLVMSGENFERMQQEHQRKMQQQVASQLVMPGVPRMRQ